MSPRVLQATMLYERSRFIEAESMLRTALDEGEQSASLHSLLGLCLLRADFPEAGQREIKKALEIDPNHAYAHYALSFFTPPGMRQTPLILNRNIRCVLRALELAPNQANYQVRLAELHQGTRDWKESLPPLDTALRLEPRNVPAAVLRAEALTRLGRRKEAREALLLALEVNPEASSAHAGMGWALLRAGDRQRATEFFNEALRLRPGLEWAQNGALECAKQQYWLYRLISFPAQRLVHRPVLRALLEFTLVTLVVVVIMGTLILLNPIIRPIMGEDGAALVMVPFLIFGALLIYGRGAMFLWLVQHHRAAQATSVQLRLQRQRKLCYWLGAILSAGTLVTLLARASFVPAVFAILGLVPGALCLWTTLKETPAVTARKWQLVYSVVLTVAGPVIAVRYPDFFESIGLGSLLLALISMVPVVFSDTRLKKQDRERRHQQAVITSRRKIIPE